MVTPKANPCLKYPTFSIFVVLVRSSLTAPGTRASASSDYAIHGPPGPAPCCADAAVPRPGSAGDRRRIAPVTVGCPAESPCFAGNSAKRARRPAGTLRNARTGGKTDIPETGDPAFRDPAMVRKRPSLVQISIRRVKNVKAAAAMSFRGDGRPDRRCTPYAASLSAGAEAGTGRLFAPRALSADAPRNARAARSANGSRFFVQGRTDACTRY